MINHGDMDLTAAEYVLGTLDPSVRKSICMRRQHEHELDAAINTWERFLVPLTDMVICVEPDPNLFARIEERISDRTRGEMSTYRTIELQRCIAHWRRRASLAAAVAACALIAFGMRETIRPEISNNYIAVFHKDDEEPAFLLTVDLKARLLTIVPVAAQVQFGSSYQLWIASERLVGTPESLGLIKEVVATTRRSLVSYDPAIIQNATFAISLEPAGGSPNGRPTGPSFHARLIPTPN